MREVNNADNNWSITQSITLTERVLVLRVAVTVRCKIFTYCYLRLDPYVWQQAVAVTVRGNSYSLTCR